MIFTSVYISSLSMCSFFSEMGNGCACVNARAQHEYPPTKHPPPIMGFLDHRNRFARFQASEPNVGLCNLKATVARVNLTAANVVALCVTHRRFVQYFADEATIA